MRIDSILTPTKKSKNQTHPARQSYMTIKARASEILEMINVELKNRIHAHQESSLSELRTKIFSSSEITSVNKIDGDSLQLRIANSAKESWILVCKGYMQFIESRLKM